MLEYNIYPPYKILLYINALCRQLYNFLNFVYIIIIIQVAKIPGFIIEWYIAVLGVHK